MRVLTSIALASCVVAVGCAGTPATSPVVVSTPLASATVASSVVPATSTPSRTPKLRECADGQHCEVAPGSYVTGPNGFFPGLEITIPANWFLSEQDAGEFALRPNDDPDNAMLLWKDVRVVATTRRSGLANAIVAEVARTPDAFVKWFTSNSAFAVIEQPKAATIAGTTGTIFAVEVSKSADYGDPGCPSNPRCADLVTDPAHWGPNFLSIGGDSAVRLYVATVTYSDGDHLFAVAWDATSATKLQTFAERTQPIIASIRLPTLYIRN